MTGKERESVQRLVQTLLRRRASDSVDNALADEKFVQFVSSSLNIPDTTELRQLIAGTGIPIQSELRNAFHLQSAGNFWFAFSNSKLLIIPLLAILLAIGAAIRFDKIGSQSQWLDEYWAVYLATGRGELIFNIPYCQLIQTPPACGFAGAPPIWSIWTGIAHVTHPPLYYLALRAWIDIFGQSDVATRSLSTVFSLAAVVMIFDIVRRGTNSTAQALAAAAMMTFAPAQIDFSQTTRPYSMLLFAALVACDLHVVLETKGFSWGRIIAFTIAVIATALTHYFAIGALAAMALYAIIRLRGKTRSATLFAFFIALIFVLITWGPMAWRARALAGYDSYVHGNVGIYEAFLNLPRRLLVHLSFETGFLMLWALAFVVYISPLLRCKRHPQLLLWWLWVICVPGFLLAWDSIKQTHFTSVTRYVLLASPAIYAIYATPLPTKLGNFVPLAFVFAAITSAFAHWQAGPAPTDDLRAVARWIASDIDHQTPVLIHGGPNSEPSFLYYAIAHYAGDWQNPVALVDSSPTMALQAELANYPRVYILTSSADDSFLPGWQIKNLHSEKGFVLQIATK
jgi:hypothetical protein